MTLFSSSSLESSSVLAKVGTSVSKFLAAFSSPGGLTAFLNLPSMGSPLALMRSTLPALTCSRKVGL